MKKWLIACLLLVAGTAQAFDIFRIVGTTEHLSFSTSVSDASTIFDTAGYARVSCSATCWVTYSATDVDTKYATTVSAMLLASEIVYLAVPQSHYIITRGQAGTGAAYMTIVEPAAPRR